MAESLCPNHVYVYRSIRLSQTHCTHTRQRFCSLIQISVSVVRQSGYRRWRCLEALTSLKAKSRKNRFCAQYSFMNAGAMQQTPSRCTKEMLSVERSCVLRTAKCRSSDGVINHSSSSGIWLVSWRRARDDDLPVKTSSPRLRRAMRSFFFLRASVEYCQYRSV